MVPTALLVAAVLTPGVPATAEAAVTVGQLPGSPPSGTCPGAGSGFDYLQTSVTGGNLYSARQAGTITSWSTFSSGAGATYTFKLFRRTSDPDFFQVVGRDDAHKLDAGLNTFSTSLQVKSGDLIGLHERGLGPDNSCTFPQPGDAVQSRSGNLSTGDSAQFTSEPDVRLNLSAVLVPSNLFTIVAISKNRRTGTATMIAELSNPGVLTVGGKGLKRKRLSTAVARRVTANIATVGKRKARLSRRGRLKVGVNVTFYPSGGDPSSQAVTVRLVQK